MKLVRSFEADQGTDRQGQDRSGAGRKPQDLDERLRPNERLTRRAEYQSCYRDGRRRHGRFLTVFAHPNEVGTARLGITASRKVGKATVRQRLRRRVREIFRRWPNRTALPPLDFVVHLKPTAAEAEFAELRSELLRLLAGRPRRQPR